MVVEVRAKSEIKLVSPKVNRTHQYRKGINVSVIAKDMFIELTNDRGFIEAERFYLELFDKFREAMTVEL
jgi:hypothetical protein